MKQSLQQCELVWGGRILRPGQKLLLTDAIHNTLRLILSTILLLQDCLPIRWRTEEVLNLFPDMTRSVARFMPAYSLGCRSKLFWYLKFYRYIFILQYSIRWFHIHHNSMPYTMYIKTSVIHNSMLYTIFNCLLLLIHVIQVKHLFYNP